MSAYVMKLIPAITLGDVRDRWLYLESWDLNGKDGRGDVKRTADLAKAFRFPDRATAMLAWREQSKHHPLRPDGKPNRPLTAYTCEIAPLETATL